LTPEEGGDCSVDFCLILLTIKNEVSYGDGNATGEWVLIVRVFQRYRAIKYSGEVAEIRPLDQALADAFDERR